MSLISMVLFVVLITPSFNGVTLLYVVEFITYVAFLNTKVSQVKIHKRDLT